MYQALALAFGLAMDATAVAAARATLPHTRRHEAAVMALLFGGFQAGMSALGWIGGEAVARYLGTWAPWIACGALAAIGLKMIVDGIRDGGDDDGDDEPRAATLATYLALAVATSLDAAIAGVSLPQLPVAPWISLSLIGGITAALTVVGFAIGRAAGDRVGGKLAILGGVVLVGIGVHVVIS